MSLRQWVIAGALLATGGCGFSPTAPFEGFDGKGTRIRGSFDSAVAAQSGEGQSAAASPQGIRVSLKERPELAVVVEADGTFVLVGLPSGSWTLVFTQDGRIVGEIRFRSVRQNQQITIVVTLTGSGQVVIVREERDNVSFEGECPRGAGFWCQNQRGGNPNLSPEEFQRFVNEAARLLSGVAGLGTAEQVAGAVCNTGDQLRRHLATLALNLAADTVERQDALSNEPYATVGEAFDAAVATANGGGGDRNRIKDVIERINENRNTSKNCNQLPDDEDDDGDDTPPPAGGSCANLQVPAGQLPPPGECKIWDPRLPAGQQGPPGNCAALIRSKPAGTCVIDHDGRVVG
jgi:hypothetical protein